MEYKIVFIFCVLFIMAFSPASVSNMQQDMNEGTCARDTCDKTSVRVEQKEDVKLRTEQDNNDLAENKENADDIKQNVETSSDNSKNEEDQNSEVQFVNYEFPPLSRIDPGL